MALKSFRLWLVAQDRDDRRCIDDHQFGIPCSSNPTMSSSLRFSNSGSCAPLSDSAKFIKHAVLRDVGMPESVKALGQGLVDCRRFADTLAPSELVDERYSGWIFDVQRHHNLQKSTFSSLSTKT